MSRTMFRDDYAAGWAPYTQAGSRYRVRCSDGVIRTALATADADTFYTIPARVQVRGRTVTGHVTMRPTFADYATGAEWPDGDPLYRFTAYTYRRNADALPEWPAIRC